MRVRTAVVALTVLLPWTSLQAQETGLNEGDRFTTHITYSNSWEEVALMIPEEALRNRNVDAAAREEMWARAAEFAGPLAADPLFVDLQLHAQVTAPGWEGA